MAKDNSAGTPGGFDWKSILVSASVPPKVVELLPPNGSPVVKRRIEANADVYLSISVLSFYHPEARKGFTKQVPLIFADAKWRRPTDEDLPQVAVMGPNPEAHPNMAKHGHYAFGGRTFFGPERFDGSVDFSIGLHLFKSNAAGRKIVDVARFGSKILTEAEMFVLKPVVDGALQAIKGLLPDKQTPWIVGVIRSLATAGDKSFETGTWAAIEAGGADPGQVYLDRQDNLLRDQKGKPLQRAYVVYSVDATDTNPDRLRIGGIPKASQRLREAHKSGAEVSDAKLKELFRHFCGEVELSDELTQRDRDEIIADAKVRFDRLMAQRAAFDYQDNAALFPAREVSPTAVSAFRSGKGETAIAEETTAAMTESLEALAVAGDGALDELVSRLHTAVSDYAALVRSNPDTHRDSAKGAAKALRDRREFRALLTLATSVREGGVDIGWLHYFGAAADIELNGAPSLEDLARAAKGEALPPMMAEAFLAKATQLAGKDFENDARLLSDCLGLQGRIWKQRAVQARGNAADVREAFERSYAFYRQGMDAGADPQFHQVNMLGLMYAAQARGVTLGKKSEATKWARAILKDIKKGGTREDWALANAGDAALYLGREEEAVGFYKRYLEEAKNKPFAVNATRRQLIEMWGVDPKGNTELCGIVRIMAQLSMRSQATVSLSIEEIEAMEKHVESDTEKLEALLDDGVKAIPAKDIRKVLSLAQCVGRVCRPDGVTTGTGFLLHGRHVHPAVANEYVFFTNDHVVCDVKNYGGLALPSKEACIIFDDLNADKVFQVSEVFWRSDSKTHDCAILRLFEQPVGLTAEFEVADTLPPRHVTQTGRALAESDFRAPRVFVLGHPDGRGLEITFEQNFLVDHELKAPNEKPTLKPVRIHYRAPTEKGNSGSPVLNAAKQTLIGIHHKQSTDPLRELPQGEKYVVNEGLWIQSILATVRHEKGEAPAAPPAVGAPAVSPAPATQPAPPAQPASAPAPAAAAVAAPVAASGGAAAVAQLESFLEPDETAEDNLEGIIDPALRTLESNNGAVGRFANLKDKPVASWAALDKHPDTKHLAHLPINQSNGTGFMLAGPVLRHALAMAATPVNPKWGRKVLFGIRGALPASVLSEEIPADFAKQTLLTEIDPDHIHYRCTMGVWDTETDEVFVCDGSTVPAVGYLWNSTFQRSSEDMGKWSNMLSPGVHSHTVGTHANELGSRQAGAFKQASKMCVMRLASGSLVFQQGNIRWDTTSDAGTFIGIHDNIHAGLGPKPSWVAKHFSAGCQVVRGSVWTPESRAKPTSHWRAFRTAAGLLPDPEITVRPAGQHPNVSCSEDGKAFTYILLTAREVRLASEHLAAPAGDLKFFKLRRGSQGETVKALQVALGIKPDGDFGFQTQRALIEKQLQLTGEADGVVTAANAASFGLT